MRTRLSTDAATTPRQRTVTMQTPWIHLDPDALAMPTVPASQADCVRGSARTKMLSRSARAVSGSFFYVLREWLQSFFGGMFATLGTSDNHHVLTCFYRAARSALPDADEDLVVRRTRTVSPRRVRSVIVTSLASFFSILLCAPVLGAQRGTASYYTYESCRREGTSGVWTASGDAFDENDLTAAMWGVPFGTRVRVTHGSNSVVVRINDRGPSKRLVATGRIIDLSKGAFLALASLDQGVIPIDLEILR